MENHNPTEASAPEDNTSTNEAVEAQESRLLAGKFESKEALLDSTAELVSKVEGKAMQPSQVIELSQKSDEELEEMYKGLQRKFHSGDRAQSQEKAASPALEGEAESLLNDWAEKQGFVRKDTLAKEKYEAEQLGAYLTQNPSAQSRVDLIKKMAATPEFSDKSFADVDKYITSQFGKQSTSTNATRPSVMGNNLPKEDVSLDDMDDDTFLEAISGKSGQARLRRTNG